MDFTLIWHSHHFKAHSLLEFILLNQLRSAISWLEKCTEKCTENFLPAMSSVDTNGAS